MPVRNGKEGGFVGGKLPPGAPLGLGIQFEFLEQQLSHLFGGGDVQFRLVRHFADACLALRQLFAETIGKKPDNTHVHFYAVAFHLGEHL